MIPSWSLEGDLMALFFAGMCLGVLMGAFTIDFIIRHRTPKNVPQRELTEEEQEQLRFYEEWGNLMNYTGQRRRDK